MAEYWGRTALLSDAISEGRLTLQINDAQDLMMGSTVPFEKDGVYQEADLDLKIIGKDQTDVLNSMSVPTAFNLLGHG